MGLRVTAQNTTTDKGEIAINKKYLIILALFGLILGGELLLPLLEEIVDLLFEWIHKILDFIYADVFGLEDEKAQKAAAWTLFFLIVALIGLGSYLLYLKMPKWWANQKANLKIWWSELPWLLKLAHIAGGLAMLGILAMFI